MKIKAAIRIISICIVSFLFFVNGCDNKISDGQQAEIAVANSYLHAVIYDLCGTQESIVNLVPPGMCPGHFDIRPSQVDQLCNCKILFVFDFQQNIEKVIQRIQKRGLKVCIITPKPGMCIPDTYLSIAQQAATALSEQRPEQKEFYEKRLQEIENRLDQLSSELSQTICQSDLENTNIISSSHQAEFAKWLGLNPVCTFSGRDTATPAQINQNLQKAGKNQIKVVIANEQEGTELAESIANHLHIQFAVFSNFPDIDSTNDNPFAFDTLLRSNLNALIQGSDE
ncbi:hypothetical protein GF406_19750 [candidate division KSB1 bacterium]|nr:hypothetical protein [candidate division KSB1 bacterium]